MIEELTIDLTEHASASKAAIGRYALEVERYAKNILVERWAGRGRRVRAVVYTWQIRIKIAGGLRVMRTWSAGADVPAGAEVLELSARACLAVPVPKRSALLTPKGVG